MTSNPNTGVEANARLTGYTAVVLAIPLLAEAVSGLGVSRLLRPHALIGFLLLPPVLLKLGSVGYRVVRYYSGEPHYRAAGPPNLPMRLLGPVLVLLTVLVFGTGIEIWLVGLRFGYAWVPVHHASAYLWLLAMAVHLVNYARRAPELAVADRRDHLSGASARRSLVVASLVLGAALAIAFLPFRSPFAFAQLPGQ
jgi:hypothetical protein